MINTLVFRSLFFFPFLCASIDYFGYYSPEKERGKDNNEKMKTWIHGPALGEMTTKNQASHFALDLGSSYKDMGIGLEILGSFSAI